MGSIVSCARYSIGMRLGNDHHASDHAEDNPAQLQWSQIQELGSFPLSQTTVAQSIDFLMSRDMRNAHSFLPDSNYFFNYFCRAEKKFSNFFRGPGGGRE